MQLSRQLFSALLYLHIAFYGLYSTESCIPNLITPGWTVPDNEVILKEGGSLEVYCVLDPVIAKFNNYSSSQLFFRFIEYRVNESKEFITDYRPKDGDRPSKHLFVLNDTTVVLRLYNLSPLTGVLHCKLEAPVHLDWDDYYSERLICSNTISVGNKPNRIENFTCYSYDWKELHCNWLEPDNDVFTTYTLQYQLPRRGGRHFNYPCPAIEDNLKEVGYDPKMYKAKKCFWTPMTDPPYRNNFEFLTFEICGYNMFGNYTERIDFHHYAHIIPSPPKRLKAMEITFNSVQLRWFIDDLITFTKGWDYKIKYKTSLITSDDTKEIEYFHEDKIIERYRHEFRLNITGLKYSNTLYEFQISMRSAVEANHQKLWGQPASIMVKTKPIPAIKLPVPKTDRSSFEVSTAEYRGNTYVYLYWQALSEIERHTNNISYVINVFKDGADHPSSCEIQHAYAKCEMSYGSNNFKFDIHSKNHEGISENASVIEIPNTDDLLEAPTILWAMDRGEGLYEVAWKPHRRANNVNYTVFWCLAKREYPYKCDGFLDWQHVIGDTYKFNLTMDKPMAIYQFAVAAVSANSSSGMVWATCTSIEGSVYSMQNVWIYRTGSNYVQIRWKLDCMNQIEGIKGYQIFYCPVKSNNDRCSSGGKYLRIDGDINTEEAQITNLEPYQYYEISMSVFTASKTSPPSATLVVQTYPNQESMTD